MVAGAAGNIPRWIRVDNPACPQAVVCRTDRRLTLYAENPRAAACVVASLPRNLRQRFGATPSRFFRTIRRLWPGPDARRRAWTNYCHMYILKPGRLAPAPRVRVGPLRPADAPLIARNWPYGRRRVEYVKSRIKAMPSSCIRRDGRPVAWALIHDDGSMGMLHVLEQFRGQGLARAITAHLARQVGKLGIQPFVYIVRTNRASISLTETMGFEKQAEYIWFGTDR